MIEDWCRFFADIEADPEAIVSGLTIGDLMAAREHLVGCDACYLRSERVLAQAPKPTIIEGFGRN